MSKLFYISSILTLLTLIAAPAALSMDFSAAREEAIRLTMEKLGGVTDTARELEPIRIDISEIKDSKVDDLLLARALHLYNQGMLKNAAGTLQAILDNDPENTAIASLVEQANNKIDAGRQSPVLLKEQEKGLASVERSRAGWLYGKEEFGGTDGDSRFTTHTAFIGHKTNQLGSDLTKNYYISESMKLEGTMSDYKYTASANVNYYNKSDKREDTRLRNATWWMQNEKTRLILGDTSSYLSRYVLNGINYRGINMKLKLHENMFKDYRHDLTLLYGKIPSFDLTEDSYIYPRDVVGMRNEFDIGNFWELNTSFAYIRDNEPRVQTLNVNNRAKENAVFSVDQVYRVMPGKWTLYGESAFSYSDDERKAESQIFKDTAHYYVSDFKTRDFKLYNSYERINPDFRSYLGMTGFTADRQVTIDREHWINHISYDPFDFMNVGLQYSKTRTNLDKRHDVESITDENYRAQIKLDPGENCPRFSFRGSFATTNSRPGPVDAPAQNDAWDTVFEVAKNLWNVDLALSAGLERRSQYVDSINGYGDAFGRVFSLSAHKRFMEDRFTVSSMYSFERMRLEKAPDKNFSYHTADSYNFNTNLSSRLWDTANLTLNYAVSSTEDLAAPSVWGFNQAITTTFAWPFTTILGHDKKIVVSPYISYYYGEGTAGLYDRTYLAAVLESDYYLTQDSKLSLSGEYRDNCVQDLNYVGFGDEYRFMLSYKTM